MMKRIGKILLTAVAASVLIAPLANAQPRQHDRNQGYNYSDQKRPMVQKKNFRNQKARHHWRKGDRVADWKRRAPVRDYYRHGLRKPPRGHHWVRVDNDYLLVGIASGLILGIVASQY